MQHKVTVEPIRAYYYDRALEVVARRIVAYRAVCSCGVRGPSRRGRTSARKAFDAEHVAT